MAQTDIKRILAYSTVSQLGFMMLGLGVGGVAVGMFHLITHAFFKALLFLGAGSVIHGCHEEQDIRRMGGLRQLHAGHVCHLRGRHDGAGGVPLLFSGFWSKDAHPARRAWAGRCRTCPFCLGAGGGVPDGVLHDPAGVLRVLRKSPGEFDGHRAPAAGAPHESPPVMTVPLVMLAVCAVVLGFVGTPAWPWFQAFLGDGHLESLAGHAVRTPGVLGLMAISSVVVLGRSGRVAGVRRQALRQQDVDPLERSWPSVFSAPGERILRR